MIGAAWLTMLTAGRIGGTSLENNDFVISRYCPQQRSFRYRSRNLFVCLKVIPLSLATVPPQKN